jgi:hypothetical protein
MPRETSVQSLEYGGVSLYMWMPNCIKQILNCRRAVPLKPSGCRCLESLPTEIHPFAKGKLCREMREQRFSSWMHRMSDGVSERCNCGGR